MKVTEYHYHHKAVPNYLLTGTLDLTNGVVKAKVTVGAAVADDYISIAYTHGASAVPGNFEVNDITIVYQEKRVS